MLIGLTYDMRDDYLAMGLGEEETAEFDRAETIEAIEAALGGLGHQCVRIGHVRELARRLVAGQRWDLVFNIAEGLLGLGREAQVPALLDAYAIPYTFSDPLVLALTLHKGLTKRVVRDLGLATPDFAVVEDPGDLAGLKLPYPLFAKPVAEGTGKGVTPASRVAGPAELERTVAALLERFRQPVLVETYLPGREFTVGLIGTGRQARPLAVMEVELLARAEPGVYSYVNKEQCEDRVRYRLAHDPEADAAAELALAAWRGLGCRDGGRVDIRSDGAGRPHFLEVNPLAGLHHAHSDLPIMNSLLGRTFRDLMADILDSARRRLPAGA